MIILKSLVCIIVAITLFSTANVAFAEYYPSSYYWDFNNHCYLSFSQPTDFVNVPHQGISYGSNLVGYWNMNEGSGMMAYDSAGNNTGTIIGSTWVDGKYGKALFFNNSNCSVNCGNSSSLHFSDSFSIAAWVKLSSMPDNIDQMIIGDYNGNYSGYTFFVTPSGHLRFQVGRSSDHTTQSVQSVQTLSINIWYHVVGVYDGRLNVYVNGVRTIGAEYSPIQAETGLTIIGKAQWYEQYFKGAIDEVRIYNLPLTSLDVTELSLQPDPVIFNNYFEYTHPISNDTMLIHVDNPTGDNSTASLITCTSFFSSNRIIFQSNNTATVNIWTNLGQPVFTSGVWNSQNFTTTLTLNSNSTAELNWNLGTPPSSLNLSLSSTIAGNSVIFSALWVDNQTLFAGGFFLSTNNTGQWINSSWIPFNSNSGWGNVSLVLNSISGATITFREYANNSLNLWGDSGIYTIVTSALAPASSPLPSPILTTTTSTNPTSTTAPTVTTTSTSSPTSKVTLTGSFPTETLLLVVIAVGSLVVMLALAFKKGYIIVQKVEVENVNETSEDYII